MKRSILLILLGMTTVLKAQDSVAVKVMDPKSARKFTHQIGFNSTLLIKQLFSNNPSSQLAQLPYQLDYTLGFGNKYAVRIGLGFDQNVQKTTIQGQNAPRTTTSLTGSYRIDLARNLMNYKKFSSGLFFGGIMDQAKLETSTVTDQSASGGPITKSELTSSSVSYGGEIGLNVKYSFNDHIGIGTELPFQVKYTSTTETDKQTITSGSFSSYEQEISDIKTVSSKIYLPTSLFLLITF